MNNNVNSHLLSNQEKWIKLTVEEVKHLFTYYIVLLIVSFLWFIFDLLYQYCYAQSGFPLVAGIVMFAIPCAVVGATIYYIRKLYKSCLQDLIVDSVVHDYNKLGAKMYFYIRPIISGVLSVLINIGIVSGFYIFNNNLSVDNELFFMFVALISFYIGYCNGKLILKTDEHGENVINLIFKKIHKETENENG